MKVFSLLLLTTFACTTSPNTVSVANGESHTIVFQRPLLPPGTEWYITQIGNDRIATGGPVAYAAGFWKDEYIGQCHISGDSELVELEIHNNDGELSCIQYRAGEKLRIAITWTAGSAGRFTSDGYIEPQEVKLISDVITVMAAKE